MSSTWRRRVSAGAWRPSSPLAVALLAPVLVGLGTASVEAQPASSAAVDAQSRWPALSPGDLLLVRAADASPHLETAIGLDLDLLRRPIIAVDEVLGTEREAVGTRVTATILYALGLLDRGQATLAIPAVYQEGEGLSAFTASPEDVLPPAAVGDLRVDFSWAFLQARGAAEPWALGVASGLVIPTGDGEAFTGGPSFGGWLDAMGERRLGPLRAMGQLGLRVREPVELGGVRVGSQMVAAFGLALELLEARLLVAAEGQALVGLVKGSEALGLGLLEVRGRLDRARTFEVALGLGVGGGDAPTTPSFEAVLTLRSVPGAGGEPPLNARRRSW